MTKILTNPQGKAYISSGGKALLSTGGGSATLISKTITQNGTYNASSDNADGYSSVTVNVSSGGVTLTRFRDDNNQEIGTHYMDFTDANGNKFKVIVLDAQYRKAATQWCSDRNTVTNMPIYNSNYNLWWYDNAMETATQNTQLILDYCTANNYTSTACSHCRNQVFTIGGTTYYGQLPNMREVFDMWRHRVQIEQMDTSASSHSSTNFSRAHSIWSSSQWSNQASMYLSVSGGVNNFSKTYNCFACPVLEIPY